MQNQPKFTKSDEEPLLAEPPRYTGPAPLGYINRSYEDGKKYITYKQPEANAIKWVFEEYLKGIHSGEYLLNQINRQGIKCSKNNFYNLLKNPTYMGKILVPSYRDEPERIVDGQHQGIITEDQFYQIQKILAIRKKEQPRMPVSSSEDLPLRGLIQCPKCTRSLTGSASKGKTRYSIYYHCRSSCGVRYRAEDVNNSFRDYLTCFIPRNPDQLIREILEEYKGNSQSLKNDRNLVLNKIRDCNQKLERARELLLENDLEPSEYRAIKEDTLQKITALERELVPIEPQNQRISDISPILIKAMDTLGKIDNLYDENSAGSKKLIVTTLFPQKLTYNLGIGRTQKSNSFAEYIFLKNSELKAKKRDKTIRKCLCPIRDG